MTTPFKAVFSYELARVSRRRVVALLFILAATPLLVSVIMRKAGATIPPAVPAWIILYGIPVFGLAFLTPGPASFPWLVGILFGSDTLACEIEDGSIIYLLSKPVSRRVVLLGKLAALSLIYLIYYLVALAVALASSKLVLGANLTLLHCAPAIIASVMISTVAFSIYACMFGLLTGKSGSGVTASIIVYFVLSVFVYIVVPLVISKITLGSISYSGVTGVLALKIALLTPIVNFSLLVTSTIVRVLGLEHIISSMIGLKAGVLTGLYNYHLASVIAGSALLFFLTLKVYESRDF